MDLGRGETYLLNDPRTNESTLRSKFHKNRTFWKGIFHSRRFFIPNDVAELQNRRHFGSLQGRTFKFQALVNTNESNLRSKFHKNRTFWKGIFHSRRFFIPNDVAELQNRRHFGSLQGRTFKFQALVNTNESNLRSKFHKNRTFWKGIFLFGSSNFGVIEN